MTGFPCFLKAEFYSVVQIYTTFCVSVCFVSKVWSDTDKPIIPMLSVAAFHTPTVEVSSSKPKAKATYSLQKMFADSYSIWETLKGLEKWCGGCIRGRKARGRKTFLVLWGQGHRCGDGACPQEAHSLIEGKKTIDKGDLFSDGLDIQGRKRLERTESSGKTSERAGIWDGMDQIWHRVWRSAPPSQEAFSATPYA